MRNLSKISPDWWDYTTLDRDILDAAAKLTLEDRPKLQRKGFKINVFDTLQEFYAAENAAWKTVARKVKEALPEHTLV